MKLANKIFTTNDILDLDPCDDHMWSIPDNWSGTLIDILSSEKLTVYEKQWVVLRLMPKRVVEVFVLDCAVGAADVDITDRCGDDCEDLAEVAVTHAGLYIAYWDPFDAEHTADYAASAHVCRRDEEKRQIDTLIYLIETYDEGEWE